MRASSVRSWRQHLRDYLGAIAERPVADLSSAHVQAVVTPLWVACPRCGVKVESVPWATGKHRLTRSYAWFLARWAKRLSCKEVAEVFHTSWDTVFGRATAYKIIVPSIPYLGSHRSTPPGYASS